MKLGDLYNHKFRHKLLLPLALLMINLFASAQNTGIKGIVVDSVTRQPVPYAALLVSQTGNGTLTDDKGHFFIRSSGRADSLRVSVMGYGTKMIPLKGVDLSDITVEIVPTGVRLNEVVVRPRKEKYSKKNNPAVVFLERIRAARDMTDPRRNDYYNFDKYERMTMAINDFNPSEGSWMDKKFDFLKDYVDVSEISGKPILNISVREKSSTVNYRRDPKSEHEHVKGMRQEGIDDVASNQEGVRQALEDVFREIDIYNNDVTLLQNRFVSPLSRIASDFYKFYLTDTLVVEQDTCVVLSFVPHTPQTWGFIGKLYVPKNDSTMFIKKVDLHLPHTINVNFIDGMTVSQTFEKAPDGSRLKTKDDMIFELSILPGAPKLYVRRNTAYENFNFDEPAEGNDVFDFAEYQVVADDAYVQTDEYWGSRRIVPMDKGEKGVGEMMAKLRRQPIYYWAEKGLRLLVSGYVHTGNPSKFDYGPINTSISFNTVEGVRLRAGGMTTANLSKRWFMRGYVAYGTKDEKIKYRGELEYSFYDKKYHSREFPVHSLRFTSLYDLDQLGQRYSNTNADNIFLSLKRMKDVRVTYQRFQRLDYILELRNNFSIEAGVMYERQEATKWIPFVDGYGRRFGHYNETSLELKLRFAPGEKFYQGKTYRMPINLDAPVFELTHTFAPGNMFGSKFTINRTELRYQQRWWLSAFGYIDAIVKGGHVWSSVPYMNLLLPNANLSYTIQPESYSLMNPLEFINDSYASVDFTYWLNGLIFNRIPLLNRLKLREVVNFKGLWGHLSDKNDPSCNKSLFMFPDDVRTTRMSNTPYMEMSVGIDNIFSVLRVDYVTRLSYRGTPRAPDWGVRVAFHLAF